MIFSKKEKWMLFLEMARALLMDFNFIKRDYEIIPGAAKPAGHLSSVPIRWAGI